MRDLLAAARHLDVEVVRGNPVIGLLADDGRVQGVQVEGVRSGSYALRSGSVILAANGFGNNKAMLTEWVPGIVETQYFGAEGSTGEALNWCTDLEARLLNMNSFQGYATVAYPHGSIVSWTTVEKGAVVLALDGRRMGNEGIGYSGFSSTVAANSDQGFVVFDTRIRDYISAHEPEFVELIESGGVREARSTVDLAAYIGCPADAVTSTLEAYNAAAENRRSDEFGRTAFGIAPLRPPYCVVRSVPALFHTQGGVDVDARAQVRRRDGSVIPGLFAGGGVTAGLSGTAGAEGYSSGNGLLSAVGLGRIAGHSAAAAAAAAAKSARVG